QGGAHREVRRVLAAGGADAQRLAVHAQRERQRWQGQVQFDAPSIEAGKGLGGVVVEGEGAVGRGLQRAPSQGLQAGQRGGGSGHGGIVAATARPPSRRRAGARGGGGSDPAAAEEGDRGQDQEDDEQDPGDVARGAGDAAETQHGGDHGDDEEDDGVAQHGGSPVRRDADGWGHGRAGQV